MNYITLFNFGTRAESSGTKHEPDVYKQNIITRSSLASEGVHSFGLGLSWVWSYSLFLATPMVCISVRHVLQVEHVMHREGQPGPSILHSASLILIITELF